MLPQDQSHPFARWPLAAFLCFTLPTLLLLGFLFFASPAAAQPQSTAFVCTDVSQITLSECNALVALYNSTDGANWITKTNWLATNTPCDWFGVGCFSGRLYALQLPNNRLSGTIPSQLKELVNLEFLALSQNQLSGTIPPELSQLANLHSVSLSQNQLSGTIPSELGRLARLQYLSLNQNQLSGTIPPELGDTKLVMLYLYNNQLSGAIPPELGKLANLQSLRLNGNQLSGSIPQELGKLANLQSLWLSQNQLNGPIPPEIGQMVNLQSLWLSANQLSGTIPPELGNLDKLQSLSLSRNRLNGPIPGKLGDTPLALLYLNNNQLSGTIPPELGKLTNLEDLWLTGNQLSGAIPPQLSQLTNLQDLWLAYNRLTTGDPALIAFLNAKAPGWERTQTVPPTNLQLVRQTPTSATLLWSRIDYWLGNGGYEVGYATQAGGPYIIHGMTPNKFTVEYTMDGLQPNQTYYFAVRTHTAAHDQNTNELYSEYSVESSATLTSSLVSLYVLAFDSNLSVQSAGVVNALQEATAADPNRVVLVLRDLNGEDDTQLLIVYGGKADPVAGLPNPQTHQLDTTLHEYNMADAASIGAFIKWARTNYPAPKTTLTYIGHGQPLAPAIDIGALLSPTLAIAAALDYEPSDILITPEQLTDEHPKALISPYALAEALRIGTDNGTAPLTLLDLVHCFGGTIEEFYELTNPGGQPVAEVMIGSPSYTYVGPTLIGRTFQAVQPNQTSTTMAAALVTAYDAVLHEADQADNQPDTVNHPRVLVAVESAKIAPVKAAVDALASILVPRLDDAATTTKTLTQLRNAQAQSQKYDTTTCVVEGRQQDWNINAEDSLSDLADFADQLRLREDSTSTDLYLAATTVISTVNAAIIGSPLRVSGKPWFAADNAAAFWTFDAAKTHGIGIYTDFQGMKIKDDSYLSWQTLWYNRTENSDNPHPYAFVQRRDDATPYTWSDVTTRVWSAPSSTAKTILCGTQLPQVSVSVDNIYLPLIRR